MRTDNRVNYNDKKVSFGIDIRYRTNMEAFGTV